MHKEPVEAPVWKKMLAGFLDFWTAFAVFGIAVAASIGALTSEGFKLDGVPALVCTGLIIAYFVIGNKYCGGTLWKHILGTTPLRFS